jgi:hypothetical protein
MRRQKRKTLWCYLDGQRHCDVLAWALAANVTLGEAKRRLTAQYPDLTVDFKLC